IGQDPPREVTLASAQGAELANPFELRRATKTFVECCDCTRIIHRSRVDHVDHAGHFGVKGGYVEPIRWRVQERPVLPQKKQHRGPVLKPEKGSIPATDRRRCITIGKKTHVAIYGVAL